MISGQKQCNRNTICNGFFFQFLLLNMKLKKKTWSSNRKRSQHNHTIETVAVKAIVVDQTYIKMETYNRIGKRISIRVWNKKKANEISPETTWFSTSVTLSHNGIVQLFSETKRNAGFLMVVQHFYICFFVTHFLSRSLFFRLLLFSLHQYFMLLYVAIHPWGVGSVTLNFNLTVSACWLCASHS